MGGVRVEDRGGQVGVLVTSQGRDLSKRFEGGVTFRDVATEHKSDNKDYKTEEPRRIRVGRVKVCMLSGSIFRFE